MAEHDAVEELLVAARKIVNQAERATESESDKAACREANDAITRAIAARKGNGEVFACPR